MTSPAVRLAVASVAILFTECTFIRWVNAYVKHLGFFTNFLLLASFLGMGVGCMLGRRAARMEHWYPVAQLLLIMLVVWLVPPVNTIVDVDVLFWGDADEIGMRGSVLGHDVVVVALCAAVALAVMMLAQPMARALTQLEPLQGYALNILGSLLGTVLFAVSSWLWLPPTVWFLAIGACVMVLLWDASVRVRVVQGGLLLASVVVAGALANGETWSPYYRQELRKVGDAFVLLGNGIAHLFIDHVNMQTSVYTVPYGVHGPLNPSVFERVLVIGSGSGNEVSVALKLGALRVTAVEINPWTAQMGREHHFDQPYSDPRVTLHVEDARAFLSNTDERYDLVVYGLPDSTALVSSHANLRQESYLFTVEAFRAVSRVLAKDGVFAMYNFYREPWLVEKLALMAREAFGADPLVSVMDDAQGAVRKGYLAAVLAGPGLRERTRAPVPSLDYPPVDLATDDWPFLYLRGRGVPRAYWRPLGLFLALAALMLAAALGRQVRNTLMHLQWPLFFMGSAFMLLQARSIVMFGLLFGSTWLTNALVMTGTLIMVLLGIGANALWRIQRILPWCVLLLATLLLSFFVPQEQLLLASPIVRFAAGCGLGFGGIFFANVVFARLWRDVPSTELGMASNVLGAVAGGMAEYLSMLVGYADLTLLAAVLYLLAFGLAFRQMRSRA